MHRQSLALLGLLTSACLRVPPVPPVTDGGPSDAGAPTPPRVSAIEVLDHLDRSWPEDGIPQRPRVSVEISEPPFQGPEPPIFLVRGPTDPALLEDLANDPLRADTEARLVRVTIAEAPSGWIATSEERLAPGEIVTIAVGGWVRGRESGLELDAPFARELIVSSAPGAGASATASWPADGAAAVPPSIPEIAVRFDGPIDGIEGGLTLSLVEGPRVAATVMVEACSALGWSDGHCAVLAPDAPLEPSRAYVLAIDASVRDATGAEVGPWSARFTTAAYDDVDPPALLEIPCAIDEMGLSGACVLADDARIDLRIAASEPVRVALAIDGRALLEVAPRGTATLSARALLAATSYAAVLRLRDLAGHVLELPLALSTCEPLPSLSVVEVRADPLGPEPRQEYVEVLNYGAVPVELSDLSLSDRADVVGDVVPRPSVSLAPGQRALLVPDDFDPDDPTDPVAVPPAIPLVRIGRSLGSGGLTNGGEPLFLRDAALHRLSASPALAAPAGSCIVRASEDPRGAEGFAIAPCTPGFAP